jgi:alpha-L-arabinofuranosidase
MLKMKKNLIFYGIPMVVFLLWGNGIQAQTRISVQVNKPGHSISPTLFGVFFEDINLSADGGIYPELIRNRSFEDSDSLENWKFKSVDGKSSAKVDMADIYAIPPKPPLNPFNRKSLCIKAHGAFTIENSGYWGMNMVQGSRYQFKMAVRAVDGFNASLNIRIVGTNGQELASAVIKDFDQDWKYYQADLTASGNDPKAHLEISGEGNGMLFLDMISLMPQQTWKNHGLRNDLASALDSLHPAFLRFPGGCWVEGDNFSTMNHWKNTVGNIDTRTSLWNIWGYNGTNGLGFHEYLQLAEDLGAEPLFCINAGISHKEIVPMDRMEQWAQDALDAIEYANGPVTSVWGGLRARNGHPAPFNLKYIEVGNENGQKPYAERWALLVNTIHAKYPEIKLIANEWAGGHPHDPNPEIIDEHYYNNPDWFIWNSNKYDTYDRKGPKIFIGEYAVTSGTGNGNLRGAIGEAAWMIGMERNSDIVVMGSYAPLLCNANHKAWPVNLINFDSYRWYGLPSYYVQKIFSNNQGTYILPVTVENNPPIEVQKGKGCIGLGTWMNAAEFKEVLVTAPDGHVLLKPDFMKMDPLWRETGKGEWSAKDGILRQTAITPGVTVFMGDTSWTDYTITLKARRLSGENGFQIYFQNRNSMERTRWDIGGWGNSLYHLEMGLATVEMKGEIEMGRWYDIKIEIRGNSAKAYLDGKLIQEISDENMAVKSLCMSAVADDHSGDIILKIVNTSSKTISSQIRLDDAKNLTGKGKVMMLNSSSPLNENTLDEPVKVIPMTKQLNFSGNGFKYTFPGNSLTVFRLATKKGN